MSEQAVIDRPELEQPQGGAIPLGAGEATNGNGQPFVVDASGNATNGSEAPQEAPEQVSEPEVKVDSELQRLNDAAKEAIFSRLQGDVIAKIGRALCQPAEDLRQF